MAGVKLKLVNICNGGETGKFCGNAENIGWMRDDGQRMVVHPTTAVRKAEWFQGHLKVLCAPDGEADAAEVVSLEGFANEDFESIWRYFEQHCNVHLKKHRAVASLDAAEFDEAMRSLEDAADRVDEAAQGSPLKKGRELDMLKGVESVRDGLEEAVSGDKQALNRVFSANNCERIGRLRLILDTVNLEVYKKDPRWLHLRNRCATVESVLKDLGTFKQWRPSEDKEHASMLRRLMVRELKRAQGQVDEEGDEEVEVPVASEPEKLAPAPQPLRKDVLEARFAHYGMAHPVYGERRAPEPAPVPEPVPSPEPGEGDSAGHVTGPGTATTPEDPPVDEEVTDPNSIMANPHASRRGTHSRESANRPLHPGSLMEGWVWKRSRFLRRWRRRWLVLMPKTLMSFKRRGDSVPTETILAGTVLRVYSADREVLQSRSFGVALVNRTYFMVCDTDAQRHAWVRDVNKVLVGT